MSRAISIRAGAFDGVVLRRGLTACSYGVLLRRPLTASLKPCSNGVMFHRDYVLHELIDGDLGALVKARRLICLEVRFIPVLRGEDVPRAGSHGLHCNDGGDRNVVKDSRTKAGE